MEEANLPEEMIVLILTWLPAKSLIRFTCVSKRFHSIILSDPKFVDCIDDKDEAAVYSSRAHAWKTHEVAAFSSFSFEGTLLKEALHWLNIRNEIFAFDLTQQEEYKFRKMLPPLGVVDDNGQNHGHLGVSAGGCLSLACFSTDAADCVHVWVMREYDVRDSWTKLFNLKFFDPPKEPWDYIHGAVLVVETGMVAGIIVHDRNNYGRRLVKILHSEDKCSMYKVESFWLDCIQYQESLLRIDD